MSGLLAPATTGYTLRDRDIARFWSKVNMNGPVHSLLGTACWDYTGARFSPQSPGAFRLKVDGVHKQVLASRVAFELQNGPLGDLWALHKCDRPICVRGDHLFAGTALENERDKIAKGRRPSHVGGLNPWAKLTEDLVIQMRLRRARGESFQSIASSVGISLMACWNAVTGKTWGHVKP